MSNTEDRDTVAAFFAEEIVSNEIGFARDWKLPREFCKAVAAVMVSDPHLGWPDEDSAMGTLEEQGWV